MGAELLAFISGVAVIVAGVCMFSSRSCQRRMWRLESRLSESEHLRLELLRQNGELRQQLDTAIKSPAIKPTRPPLPRTAPPTVDTTSAAKPAPAQDRQPPDPGPTLAPAPSWEDTQPLTTAPAPFSAAPAGSLIPRLRR